MFTTPTSSVKRKNGLFYGLTPTWPSHRAGREVGLEEGTGGLHVLPRRRAEGEDSEGAGAMVFGRQDDFGEREARAFFIGALRDVRVTYD
jgi:hypothetical protein